MNSYCSETWMIDLLSKLFQTSGGAFIDVGINLGQTLIKVKALDSDGEYIGFEPNPACVFYVQELVDKNSYRNCIVVPVGLWMEDCILPLTIFSEDLTDSMAFMIDDFHPDHHVQSQAFVPVFRFDSLNERLRAVSAGVIKIDVEGSELEIINGTRKLIECDRLLRLIEILSAYFHDNQLRISRQVELERIFREIRFTESKKMQMGFFWFRSY